MFAASRAYIAKHGDDETGHDPYISDVGGTIAAANLVAALADALAAVEMMDAETLARFPAT